MTDEVVGVDNVNVHAWSIRPIKSEAGWIGTAQDMLFATFPTIREALGFFIDRYPDVHELHFYLNGKYARIDLKGLRLNLVLDGIEAALAEVFQ